MPSLRELMIQKVKEQELSNGKRKKGIILDKKKVELTELEKSIKRTVKKDNAHKITSDAIRTAYYLLAGKSSRKRIEDVKSDLIKILNVN